MGLAVRIIPTMLVRGAHLVKGRQFQAWRVVGHALQAARIYAARGVDELILLDIAATREGRGPDLELVEKLSAECFTPLTVGGGVKTVEDVRRLLKAGADKVAIGSWASVQFVSAASARFGSQCIVIAVDAKNDCVWRRNATRHITMQPKYFAELMADTGAGEILLTSIEREGTMEGYDLKLVHEVSQTVGIPVIAHGGAGTYQHMLEAIQAGAHAVAAGAMFQFTDQTPEGAAEYLRASGIETRSPHADQVHSHPAS